MKNTNQKIADIFQEMAAILEIQEVAWKPQAYRDAARSLENMGEEVGAIYKKGGLKALEEIPGVGEHLGQKIIEFLQTKKIKEYEDIKRRTPPGLLGLLEIPGLGPKRVRELYKTLHIQSSPDLKKYLKDHVGDTPPRFVKKTMETLAENLGLQKANAHRITYAQALARADEIISVLKKTKLFDQVEAVGSLRRKESTIGDIDILIVSNRDDALQQALGALPSIQKILSNGPQKASVLLETGPQADFRVFDQQTLGSARIYFTGNKAHNIQLRKIAIRKGFKLNEYGLFDAKGQKLAGAAEKDIYGKLGFKWVPPEKRKGTREFEDYRL